jgi:TRAP-type uncharacterized transport system substrate-binding protein
MESSLARVAAIGVAGLGVALGSVFVAFQSAPIVPGKIVMATGSSPYHQLAETYRRDLERNGVELELRRTSEAFATLTALLDSKSGLNAGFIKGGLVGSLQGRLATTKAKGRHAELSKLHSVGRLFYEPIWVFTRSDLPITSLRDLKGKRVLTGTRESGTRRLANVLLKANGIERDDVTRIEGELDDSAGQLIRDEADVAILSMPPDADKIQQLLRVPNIRLMDFSPEADAYDNRFPAVTKVVLKRGSVEFNPIIPSADITLLATTAALVVRSDMDPALINLLTHAVINNPMSGFDKDGDPVLFYRAGEFPSINDPEFEVAPAARLVYKSGELPYLLRTLAPMAKRWNVPFSVTAFINTHGAKLILLIPILALLLPLTRLVPALYVWYARRRLVYWYRQLKTLERNLDAGAAKFDHAAVVAELARIDSHVRRIRLPVYFSDRLYDLRGHIELVRQRIVSVPAQAQARMAAE